MGSNCSSASKKKDKDKSSVSNENKCGSNEQRRVSSISVESLAYGNKDTSLVNISDKINNDTKNKNQITNSETKTADFKIVAENDTSHSSNAIHSHQPDTQIYSNQPKILNKCISLKATTQEKQETDKHQTACSTNSNPSESSTTNRPVRNCYDVIFTFETIKSHIILSSNDRNELCVYNLKTGQYSRKLRNINKPRNVILIDKYRAVVLCDRELGIFNLDEGRLITKLKGVMNQKMPFYGLHDQNYAVTLSRNRMYVNMINLETGNLETTFKVGEDRFLNSLLVSKNGKICVCGDETQKPFPLLCWNLSNRKLIYDLRIPNHEFITSLSAISNDGHYVVCVCKETSSDSSNFIVVYDLQSGTLFKKWKPDHNTISITISSDDNCVVNGLESKLIQVWDLSTGGIRHVLEGHQAPVNKLKVADEGEFLLSFDSTLTDQTIRVWSLITGICVKTYTPDFSISCCTLSSNGRLLILCPDNSPTVKIIHIADDSDEEGSIYGDPEREGIEFDLSS